MGVFGHDLWGCPSFAGCLWCSSLGLGFGLLMGHMWLRARSTCPPLFPVPVCAVGVRAGPGSLLYPAPPGWVVGVCFLRFFFSFGLALWCRLLGVPVPGLVAPVPRSPFFRTGLLALFFLFFFSRGVCLHVSVSLFQVDRCAWLGVAGFGWVVPLCLSGGPVFGAFWVGGLAASCGVGGRFGVCGLFSRPPPPVFLFWGGAACSSLCLPWAGARTGPHSVWSSGLLLAVAFCLALFRAHGSTGLCTRWVQRPFLPG